MNSIKKIILAVYVTQFFLLTTGDLQGGRPEVGCVYFGQNSDRHGILYPEELDPSICSQLIYIVSSRNHATGGLHLTSLFPWNENSDEDFISRLPKLKEVNPDLKLFLALSPLAIKRVLETPRSADEITNAVKWMNETGFDGLEFPFYLENHLMDKAADLICDYEVEFRKHNYMLSAMLPARNLPEPIPGKEAMSSKLARCCNHITMFTEERGWNRETFRLGPLNVIKGNVESMLGKGIPANKIKFSVPVFSAYLTLEDPNETELGSKYSGPGLEYEEITGWNTIRYKELLRRFNDSSLEWTFRRDNVTEEPYAFSSTGLWTSYEDTTSIAFKARYALDKGLSGIYIAFIDLDDDEGIGGEGRFPLTRAVYNTFRRGNNSLNKNP